MPPPSFHSVPHTEADISPSHAFSLTSGGGIAGLALAITLGKHLDPVHDDPIAVDLYEAGPSITTVGAGISVWTRTWQVMRMLGLERELAEACVDPPDPDEGQSASLIEFGIGGTWFDTACRTWVYLQTLGPTWGVVQFL